MFDDMMKAIAEMECVKGTSHSAAVTNIDDINDIIDSVKRKNSER